ncbi:putative aminoacyltransferase, E1 ubiquitin-activating enzyme [Rosa chinensis]|uniref:HECT-type E3 ubiquitin transferase n=1 Tax=Rosa chinensis TaxID=74649 RepID=A0A2P6RAL0_ROSCH|nr:E3 ubiquitin-protein ligase UPL4 [Rosa chinensis]PRQ43454.1 putative aminoacyltransferase, E1 ubiquitin-activating enzyme [Rosa chinensis]
MESRGQKRSEIDDELPADKRACSSLEFRPSTSSSSQTPINSVSSTPERNDQNIHDHADHMDTESEGGEPEKDSAYDSCDEDEEDQRHSDLRDYQRRRASGDHGRFQTIISSLSEEVDLSQHLVMLTELCEVLSFCTEDSLSGDTSNSLSPILVKLSRDETSADIMLLAIRAMTYLCDVYPKSSVYLVRHDAVPALCQRLLAIEYLDVAEQCLQALEKLSREQPLACLQAGAIMAVLNYIDFFSTSIQRVALSTVVNICKKLPSEGPSPFMDAVPTLCNLLQYEDPQLVENVAICLIRITERVSQSSEMLDELCKHGLIRQATHFMSLNSRTTLSQPIHNGLIGLLVKLSSGSVVAFRTLYELNMSSILKDILSTYDLSHGMSSTHVVDGHCYQVYEVLKLLNELLPTSARDQDAPQLSEKESFLINRPELLEKFGRDILPSLIQVVNSGANLYICYGCLSVINKLIYLSTSDMLVELLKNANISSFLAGVFTRKDPHVLVSTLQIAELILQKFSDNFLDSFIKEGVFFAIDALLTPEKSSLVTLNKCSKLVFPVSSGTRLLSDSSQKSASKEVLRCLCYAFPSSSPSGSEKGSCMLEKDSVYSLAKHVRTKYFAPELCDPDKSLTDVLQKLRTFSASLSDLMNMSLDTCAPNQHEESFYGIMHQVMEKLGGREPISTFELIESGILKSLMTYLSNDRYLRQKGDLVAAKGDIYAVEKRFEVFARLLFSLPDPFSGDLPIVTLIRRLQSSLSTLENFPVILSHIPKQRNSYATVPYERYTAYPCMRARFVRDKEETTLGDCCEDVLTVDPFSSLDAIEGYVWPKVNAKGTSRIKSATIEGQSECTPSNASSSQGGCPNTGEPESMSADLPELKADEVNLTQPEPEQEPSFGQTNPGTSLDETYTDTVEKEVEAQSEEDTQMEEQCPLSCSSEDASPKLLFYLEGKQLERSLTLYQAILQQQMKEHEIVIGSKLWSKVYTLTYRKAVGQEGAHNEGVDSAESSTVSDKVGVYTLYTSLFSNMFPCELASDLEKSNPTYDIVYLLKSLESMNKFIFHLLSRQRICAFAEGKINDLDAFQIAVTPVPQNEFLSSKLTEKLEQQMRDGLAVSVGGMPLWCNQLMASCPFLFSFEVKCKYFRLAAFVPLLGQPPSPSHSDSGMTSDRRQSSGGLPRQKFLVFRNRILDSAAQMMELHACQKVLLEVEYDEEVGTGLGPTLEFYTLVSHEFQKSGLGMWREDGGSFTSGTSHAEDTGILISPCGLFPRPWSSTMDASDGTQFSEVIKKFALLGKIVGKALQDGRVLDLHFSKAFYKLILGQDLGLYDIQSFDPVLGRTLLEFKALVERKRFLESVHGENTTFEFDSCFRETRIEDLCLDFTLPGYPDFVLASGFDHKMVNSTNLEDYVSLMADATINSGISRQVEAFKSGFNQVFPIEHLQIFTEEELERLLCGERDSWAFNELLDHIKFDHGYTASSPPIVNLLEIIHEFDQEKRRAFLQFVTGAPRLPPGGFASLNPKLTIVRKHSSNSADLDLPSVMTCANYLKLPPYSLKEMMKEKLVYAIKEGQGSFHLS